MDCLSLMSNIVSSTGGQAPSKFLYAFPIGADLISDISVILTLVAGCACTCFCWGVVREQRLQLSPRKLDVIEQKE